MSPRENLYKNARSSIDMGITDHSADSPTRASSGVRNFYAGLLLLAKYVLALQVQEDEIDLILAQKVKLMPGEDGKLIPQKDGQRTLDFDGIANRLKDFGIEFNKKDLAKLNSIRTDIEHYYSPEQPEAIREVLAKAFPVAVELFRHAGKDPKEELGANWDTLISLKEVYDSELERCVNSFGNVAWPTQFLENLEFVCPNCQSDLIIQNDPNNSGSHEAKVKCLACGNNIEYPGAVEAGLNKVYLQDLYMAASDGDALPLEQCPSCGSNTYIVAAEDIGCVSCGYSVGHCLVCSEELTTSNVSEKSSMFCSYCAGIGD